MIYLIVLYPILTSKYSKTMKIWIHGSCTTKIHHVKTFRLMYFAWETESNYTRYGKLKIAKYDKIDKISTFRTK